MKKIWNCIKREGEKRERKDQIEEGLSNFRASEAYRDTQSPPNDAV